jgi:hypothetical protein
MSSRREKKSERYKTPILKLTGDTETKLLTKHINDNNNKSEEERRESRPTKKDLQDVQKPRFLLLSGGCGGRVRGFAIRIR